MQDGDVAEEKETEPDRDESEPIAEERADLESVDGDSEAEAEAEPDDDDLTIDPDPNWEKELDAEPKEADDPYPSFVRSRRFYFDALPLEVDERLGWQIEVDKNGLLIPTSHNRLLALDLKQQLQWQYSVPNQNNLPFLYKTANGAVYFLATRYTNIDSKPTTVDNFVILLDRETGHATEFNLTKILGVDENCDPPDEDVYRRAAMTDDWLAVLGRDLCSATPDPSLYIWGISRLDKKLKWRIPADATPIYPHPDGSIISYSYSPQTDQSAMTFKRISPLGEILADKVIALPSPTSVPLLLSNGAIIIQIPTGLLAISLMGEIIWQRTVDIRGVLTMIDEDDCLITQVRDVLYRYTPNGDYLHEINAFPMDFGGANSAPSITPAPWRWGLVEVTSAACYLEAKAPYYGQPEDLPSDISCATTQAGSSVVTRSHEPAQAATEDWTLRRVKDDSTYSCPLKPDIANPFDSWAANAWSDATLDTVWIGGYDALWRYDTRTREATCLKIGNVEVISGHINQGATTLAYVTDGRLFIGPADGSATTSHALPDDMGVILSLALDADTIAIGGPKGLWLRALTTETWTKIESCCGAGLQVNQSGLFLDGGTLWAGAYGGVYRIDPVAKSCAPQCLATEPDMIFEIYGRSEHGVWVAWQGDPSRGQRAPYIGNTVGECLDNGVWFPQLKTPSDKWVLTGSKTTEGWLALAINGKSLSSNPELPDCVSEVTVQSWPEPIGRSAPLTIPLASVCGFGECCPPAGNVGEKLVPTKNGYFASGLWLEAKTKSAKVIQK